jgi:hypothetical protein
MIDGEQVDCLTCGASGRLAVEDGTPVVRFDDPAGLRRSVSTRAEKRAHDQELVQTGERQAPLLAEIAAEAARYKDFDRRRLPSRV